MQQQYIIIAPDGYVSSKWYTSAGVKQQRERYPEYKFIIDTEETREILQFQKNKTKQVINSDDIIDVMLALQQIGV